MSATAPHSRPNRRIVWLLALVFFAPLCLSFVMYYGSSWRPAGHTNHGLLIEPPRTLPAVGAGLFTGKWSLVYVGAGDCDAACRRALYFMRQTYLGLGNLTPRVQRVFIVTGNCCDHALLEREYSGLITFDPPALERAALLAQFPADARAAMLYIVDPRGNLMMRYDSQASPRGLHEDLEKLLHLSHIG
ncbi:MAG: hypothetical protein ABSF96_01515 [Steroidobacteraceae bacterium]|jgi:hypothetical protein